MGYGYRSAHIGGPRGRIPTPLDSPRFDVDVPPCPSSRSVLIQQFDESSALPTTPATAKWPQSAVDQESGQVIILRLMSGHRKIFADYYS